jgi:hypothetical protein
LLMKRTLPAVVTACAALCLAACLLTGCGREETPGARTSDEVHRATADATSPGDTATGPESGVVLPDSQDSDGTVLPEASGSGVSVSATADSASSDSVGQESDAPPAREQVVTRASVRPGNAEDVATGPESGLRVSRAYVCKGIEESEPTEAGRSFIPEGDGVLRLCCFSEIEGAAEADTIFHVWYWGDREMARVPLEVRGSSWRTWSSKRIADDWRGRWHVDITDRTGTVLARLDFSVE